MNVQEIRKHFKDILMEKDPYYGQLPSKFTAKEFIQELLEMTTDKDQETMPWKEFVTENI